MLCRDTVNAKGCIYRCKVTKENYPRCEECPVTTMMIDYENKLNKTCSELLGYKEKANKFDELMEAIAKDMFRTVLKALHNIQ